MISLRGVAAILILAIPALAAPVPAPVRDEPVSPIASLMLRDSKVQGELRLSTDQQQALANVTRASIILAPAQRSRLRQLERQVLGPAAFNDTDVQKALQFTDSQKQLAADLVKQLDRRVADYLAIFGNDDADNLKAELLAFRRSAMKQIDAALRDEQRSLWKTLTGEPATALDPDLYWLYVLVEVQLRSR